MRRLSVIYNEIRRLFSGLLGGPEPTLQSISCMLKMGNTFQRRFRWQNV